jgi:hypothetical protein
MTVMDIHLKFYLEHANSDKFREIQGFQTHVEGELGCDNIKISSLIFFQDKK